MAFNNEYSNPQTQRLVDGLYTTLARNERKIEKSREVIALLRRNKQEPKVYNWTARISDLSPEEQDKVIRFVK